jgi:hypothetical protein
VGRPAITTMTATDTSRYISERRDKYDYGNKGRENKETFVLSVPTLRM